MIAIVQIIATIITILISIFLIAVCFGVYLKKKGQTTFNAEELKAEGGKYITTADGRAVEYFTAGSDAENAKVVINIHGSGSEAMEQHTHYNPICEALGLRCIAVSLPGCGYSDMKPGRQVKDWPKDDLEPILRQEGVENFMITGHSQGNPHAMAAAWYFGSRCEGMGLYAPLLPAPLCREMGIKGAIGANSIPRTDRLRRWYMAWYFAVFHLSLVTFSPWLPLRALIWTTRKLKEDPELIKHFRASIIRSVARGSIGNTWESAFDVCFEWGFDPRQIQTKNICIWHAADDSLCPPEHGRWLAGEFGKRDGVRVNYRDDNQGFGHFTYSRGEFIKAENSIIKALIDGNNDTNRRQ